MCGGGSPPPPPPPAPPPAPPKPKPVVTPTKAEVEQSAKTDAIETKKKGRYATIATGRRGVLGAAQVTKKTLLG